MASMERLSSRLSWSEETLEDWCAAGEGAGLLAGGRPKSHTLPKSPSLHEQLWEGIQRKSQDLLRGTGMHLLNRSQSKEDALQVQAKRLEHLCCLPPFAATFLVNLDHGSALSTLSNIEHLCPTLLQPLFW
jgi:hypothetical protein